VLCPACRTRLPETDQEDGERRCPGCGQAYLQEDGILDLSGGRPASSGYDPHYFETLPLVEDRHFWYVHRREAIRDALRRHVKDFGRRPLFDVGCGSGGLLAWLAGEGVPIAGGCDAFPQGLRLARRRLPVRYLLVGDQGPPPLAPGVPMLAFFDVLEHLDEDVATLRWARSVLDEGGYVVLSVPAHPFLFDEADRLARHRRRYTGPELRSKLEEAGLEVVLVRYVMALLVPLLLVARFLGGLLPGRMGDPARRRATELRVQPGLNAILDALLRGEEALAGICPLPFGTSLIALARRPVGPRARLPLVEGSAS
jgi:SAM-dependent methyltransferase